jgi:hypothetical protein
MPERFPLLGARASGPLRSRRDAYAPRYGVYELRKIAIDKERYQGVGTEKGAVAPGDNSLFSALYLPTTYASMVSGTSSCERPGVVGIPSRQATHR